MTDAFRATYSDWKVVKGRKVVQVVLELPLEAADQAYQVLGGMPMAANEIWCAVARLDEGKVMPIEQQQSRNTDTPPRLESNASAGADNPGYCVVVAMGGPRCVGRCEVPKDCGATPLPADKPKKSPAQIAGYLCTTMAFYRFLKEKFPEQLEMCDEPSYGGAAAQCVRIICDVDSRADIKADNVNWSALLLAYKLWQNHPELEDA